jgi:hypothetical protein
VRRVPQVLPPHQLKISLKMPIVAPPSRTCVKGIIGAGTDMSSHAFSAAQSQHSISRNRHTLISKLATASRDPQPPKAAFSPGGH